MFRKGRLSTEGTIDCQNMANTCPILDCPDPQSIPGQCCKTCPDVTSPNRKQTRPKRKQTDHVGSVPDIAMGDQARLDTLCKLPFNGFLIFYYIFRCIIYRVDFRIVYTPMILCCRLCHQILLRFWRGSRDAHECALALPPV